MLTHCTCKFVTHLEFSQSMRIINPKFALVYSLKFCDKGQLFHFKRFSNPTWEVKINTGHFCIVKSF